MPAGLPYNKVLSFACCGGVSDVDREKKTVKWYDIISSLNTIQAINIWFLLISQ